MRRPFPLVLFLTVPTLLAATTGCRSSATVAAEKNLAAALVSDEQERQIGQQLHEALEHEGVRLVQDPQITGYVDALAGPVLHAAERDRKGVEWHVHVVDDPNQVNAFATPGGHLYVFSGLVRTAGDEAELAGVIAHEAAHVTARHAARAMVQQFGLGALANLALGQDPGLAERIAAQAIGTGTLLYHGRGAELEADRLGARYAAAAGHDPDGLARFLEKLLAREGKQPALARWLSTHPATDDRVTALRQFIAKEQLPRPQGKGPGQLAQIQQRLGGTQPAGPGQAPAPKSGGGGRPTR